MWFPEQLGLQPGQAALLKDDRVGRALDDLQCADRASLLTILVLGAVGELHQVITTATYSRQ